MDVGVVVAHDGRPGRGMAELGDLAATAESAGLSSFWVPEHVVFVRGAVSRYPYNETGELRLGRQPGVYDPLVALAYVAAQTERIRLGTAVINLPYYQPAMLARQLATLDVVSGGRLTLGAGVGWSEDEYQAVGVPFEKRGRRMDEFLRCLKACWTDEIVEFHGDFYEIPATRFEPKPVQRPHPPIVVGGYAKATIRRAVTLADGYIGGNVPFDKVAPMLERLGEAAAEAGRDPAELHVISRGAVRVFEARQGPERRPLYGTIDELRQDVERYRAAGLTELFIDLNFDPRVASPRAHPADSLDHALGLMRALAP